MPPSSITTLPATGAPLLLPGCWDALSAVLAVRAGFQVVFLSGYCLSATRLAEPDFGLLTQTEVLDAARRIALAVADPSMRLEIRDMARSCVGGHRGGHRDSTW